MQLAKVYQKFNCTPNLQEHMLRVYGISAFIKDHWIGKKVDWEGVKKICLLHDIGNIVKFNLEEHASFLGEEQKNITYWKEKQKETREKYGWDDDEANKKMLSEMGLAEELVGIIFNKRFGNSVFVKNSDNWMLKILYYADLRTLPHGLGSLKERLEDVRQRMPKYTGRADFEDLVSACFEIEKQIQEKLNVPVLQINDQNVIVDKALLTNLEI